MEAYYEYIDFILASSGVGLALCLAAYAFNYIRTLVVVRRLLEKEVESRSPTSLLYMYSLYPPVVYIVYQYLGGGGEPLSDKLTTYYLLLRAPLLLTTYYYY